MDPNLLTHAQPGDLFVLRNAGNLIPPFGAVDGGEAATIEFAVAGLGVRDIIVCGHSLCGAMKGLLEPAQIAPLPALTAWLGYAEATRRIMRENYQHLTDEALLTATVEENVLVQLENLRTHPSVASRILRGDLHLHGWVYEIESGAVFGFQPEQNQFVPIAEYASTRPGAVSPSRSRRIL